VHEDGGAPVVVRRGEEDLGIRRQQGLLLVEVGDEGDEATLGLAADAQEPLVLDSEPGGAEPRLLDRRGQRQRDAANVSFGGHGPRPARGGGC